MELYEIESTAEKVLQQRADENFVPLGGTIELLPLCNMDCKMCYVRKTKAEMDREGRMLSCDQWLDIARQAIDEGLLFLLLTGGEPLIYPEFKRLYSTLAQKGVVLTVNTNGTLIDEEWADFFAANGCRRLNITLYGKDDRTYGELCNNPRGFTQVMNACRLLKQRNVPFRLTCSVTPTNADQLPELFAIARQFDVPLYAAAYMFPGSRRGVCAEEQYRMTPEECARTTFWIHHLEFPEDDMVQVAKQALAKLMDPPRHYRGKGFNCHAGRSGFWINWKGELSPCGMFSEPMVDLHTHSFRDGWKHIVDTTQEMAFCEDCKSCRIQNLCSVCPAKCYTESGRTDLRPDYVCRTTMAEVNLLEEFLRYCEEVEHHE